MPVFRSHTTIEIMRGLRAFLNLEVGLTRGAVPEEPDEQRAKQAQSRKKNKNRQLKRVRERLSNQDPKLEPRSGAKPTPAESAVVPQQPGALEKSSDGVSDIEVGSVPARETLYLGHPFVYPYDSAIGKLIDRGHEWDAVLHTIVTELLPEEEPAICEVGSNIGASLLQILAAKPYARIVAFEPTAYFRPFLERNLELAGFDRVEVLPLLMGRTPGSMWLYKNSTTASAVDSTAAIAGSDTLPPGFEPLGKELVEMTTLDEVFRDRGPVDFIKVDTDGFDFEVLRGAKATLKRDRPVLHFEFEPRYLTELTPSAPVEGLDWLQGVGYRRLVCLNPSGQLVGTTDDPEQVVAWADANTYCDVLTCPEGSASEARLGDIEFD